MFVYNIYIYIYMAMYIYIYIYIYTYLAALFLAIASSNGSLAPQVLGTAGRCWRRIQKAGRSDLFGKAELLRRPGGARLRP